jgi:hypothetical protein
MLGSGLVQGCCCFSSSRGLLLFCCLLRSARIAVTAVLRILCTQSDQRGHRASALAIPRRS